MRFLREPILDSRQGNRNNFKRKRFWVALGVSMLLTACSGPSTAPQTIPDNSSEQEVAEESGSIMLDDYGPAPEIENEVWLNTQSPLRLADLRGSVVLLEMWTFG